MFEEIEQNDFQTQNNWQDLKFNKETGEFVSIKKAGSKETEEVLKITLKVKDNVKAGKEDIVIKDLTVSEGKEDINVEEIKTTIDIIEEQSNIPGIPNEPDKPDINGGNNSNNNDNSGNHGNIDTNLPSTLPKTGISNVTSFILIAIEILIVFAYVNRRKGKHIQKEIDKRTKMLMSLIVTGVISVQLVGTIYATVIDFASKGELNDDGKIDYIDVNLLELHLIHQNELVEDKLENADMNSDKKITVTDLTLLVQKIENTLDYEVNLSDMEQATYYPNKNEDITLTFLGDVSYGAKIKKVVINGQEYDVQKAENGNTYTVKVGANNTSGLKEYKFTEVILDNNKKVKINYTIKIDVLKDIPSVENYRVEENVNESKIKVLFDLKDEDNSITSSTLEFLSENYEKIQNYDISKGNNEIEIPVEDGKKYKIKIVVNYELDSNSLIDHEKDNTGLLEETKDLEFVIDYNWQISNIGTYKNNEKTTEFEKGEPITIKFNSTNVTKFEPQTIKVNGKEYVISKENNQYVANIDGITDLGKNTIRIEEIKLSNGKVFKVENNNIEVTILKKKPIVSDFKANEDIEKNKLNISFKLQDEDNAIKTAKIILLNDKQNNIAQKDITVGTNEVQLDTEITSKYTVKIIATYRQKENEEIKDSVLLIQEVQAKPRVEIKNIVTDKSYVEKSGNVTITLEVKTNKTQEIEKIRVNNTECSVTKLKDGKYKLVYMASKNAGIQDLNITKVIFADKTEANTNKTVKIEVLKDKPTFENFEQIDNLNKSEVTLNFDINDAEQSFIRGKAVLINNETKEKQEKDINSGKNNLTFTVKESTIYNLEIKVTYDRDTNKLEGHEEIENKFVDEKIATEKIELLADYKLEINNMKTHKNNKEEKYFAKNEKVAISFESSNASMFISEKVVIGGKEFNLTFKENTYILEIDGYANSGVQTITIDKVILSNSKEINVTQNNTVKIEILKDVPTISEFKYEENDNNKIIATFNIIDSEKAIKNGTITILDESGKEIATQAIVDNVNTITFDKTSSEKYSLNVTANYDLDSNAFETGKNEYANEILLEEEIETSDRMLEMKDIRNATLYKQENNVVNEIDSLNISELNNLENFLVKVEMKDLPSFYSTIREYKVENNILKLVLNYDNTVQYDGEQKHNYIEVEYGKVVDGVASQSNLSKLIEKINKNPAGTYELTTDVDASTFTSGEAIITQEFSGKINFNGHEITGLSRPLFKTLRGATIENLVIKDSNMTASGALATDIYSSTVRNVHLTNLKLVAKNDEGTGSIAGNVKENSLIEECSATNIEIGNKKRIGGLIGRTYNTTIKNCYVTGVISSDKDCSAGLVGETPTDCKVENCYVDVKTNFTGSLKLMAGMLGNSSNVQLKNSLSLAKSQSGDNNGNRVVGGELKLGTYTNNYELETSNLISNASGDKIQQVNEDTLKTKDFYTKKLKWDEKIWNFDNVKEGQYPTLRNADSSNKPEEEKPSNSKLNIPYYERLKKLDIFDQSKEIAYHNMYKLMPYYDAKYYVIDGNKIDVNHELNTKLINQVLPYDKDGKLIVGLSQQDKTKIKTIKILLEDNSSLQYTLEYENSFKTIANYKINELGIGYNYNKYLIDITSKTYKDIISKIKSLDYKIDIASITPEEEVRNYTENYPRVQAKAEEFTLKFLANNEDYAISVNNKVLENKVNQDLEKDKTLEKVLYAYNYFDRFYGFEIGGINITDIVFFDGNIFSKQLNSMNMTNTLLEAPQSERLTQNLPNFYNNRIKQYTGKSLGLFIEYFMQNLTIEKYKQNPASWLPDNYWGTICEYPAKGQEHRIKYRVWDHMKNREFLILPILSYKGNDFYVVGVPTVLLVGNMRLYFPNRDFNTVTKEEKLDMVKSFADKAGNLYGTVASIVNNDTVELANTKTHISYDTTGAKDQSQDPNCPEVYKAFNEVINNWVLVSSAAAAHANGIDIYWSYSALKFFNIFSHEAIHNQDAYLYMENTGRRRGASGEMYTDGFLTQRFGEYGVIPNYSFNYKLTDNISTNLTPERINSREKIDDYYKKIFEVYTILEYLEGQAFLKLTPEEQSQLAFVTKEEIIDPEKPSRFLRQTLVKKTPEEFEKMNLKSMSDLWDNKIVTVRDPGKRDMGSTTFIGSSMWYIGNFDDGISEETFKTIAYQIMGEYGYDGYVKYAGGTYDNDVDAIRGITGDSTMTWKKYQMNRYKRVESKLNEIKYFDSNEVINQMVSAMKSDIENGIPSSSGNSEVTLRKTLYGYIKRATNDFSTGGIYDNIPNEIHISTASGLIETLAKKPNVNIVLDKDIDFTNITTEGSTYLQDFTGSINGNNHKITGLKKPLFNKIIFSKVKNLKIENANISSQETTIGSLAKTVQLTTLENINLNNITIQGSGNASGDSTVGGLAGYVKESTVNKISLNNSSISGTNNLVGGVFARAEYTTIQNTNIANSSISGKGKVGGIAGEINNSTVENCYTLGSVTGNNNVGGFVGWVTASRVRNCFANTTVKGNAGNCGGFVGIVDQKTKNTLTKIENNISFGNVSNGYKFDGRSAKDRIETNYKNNYEYKESTGTSTLERTDINFDNKISIMTKEQKSRKDFYTNILNWNSDIWDFSNITNGELPQLKK